MNFLIFQFGPEEDRTGTSAVRGTASLLPIVASAYSKLV